MQLTATINSTALDFAKRVRDAGCRPAPDSFFVLPDPPATQVGEIAIPETASEPVRTGTIVALGEQPSMSHTSPWREILGVGRRVQWTGGYHEPLVVCGRNVLRMVTQDVAAFFEE
jgi:co-chaperonin GroES (HSP10)